MSPAGGALSGRRAIVTGAAQGLGRAFALALAEAGAAVAVADRRAGVDSVGREIEALGPRGWARVADLSDPAAVASFVEGAALHMGGIDILVNNAGSVRQTSPATDSWEQAIADFDAVIGDNYRTTYLVGRAAIPHLIRQGGDIVNITTDHIHTCGYPEPADHSEAPDCRWASSRRPPLGGPKWDVYDSSKWAVKGLATVWAAALAEHGVRVNALGMGATDTPMIRAHLKAKGVSAPPSLMRADQVAAVLVELIAEGPHGRTGDSIELWADHPCALPPVSLDGRLVGQVLAASR